MNTCDSCKYFKEYGREYSREGKCLNEDVSNQVHVSGFDEEGVEFDRDFGCIHHEDKK